MIDLCTVVFRDEIDILHTQARSIARYVSNIANIYVIVNDSAEVCDLVDTSQWAHYQNSVQVLHRNAFGQYWTDTGWVSQQVLKLASAALSQAPHCVALDAKTIFVRPLPDLVQGNQIAVGTLPVYSVFEASRQIVNNLWNINLDRQLGPGGVPFWFEPQEVRAMIADIERRTHQNFISWFQDQGRLTEFLLYSGWIEYNRGIDCVAAPRQISVCNLCHSELARADHKLEEMHHSHTVSVHRHAWTALTVSQQQAYLNLLAERLR